MSAYAPCLCAIVFACAGTFLCYELYVLLSTGTDERGAEEESARTSSARARRVEKETHQTSNKTEGGREGGGAAERAAEVLVLIP